MSFYALRSQKNARLRHTFANVLHLLKVKHLDLGTLCLTTTHLPILTKLHQPHLYKQGFPHKVEHAHEEESCHNKHKKTYMHYRSIIGDLNHL